MRPGPAYLGDRGAVLLVLFSLGHALEGYAMGRARRSIEALGARPAHRPRPAGNRRSGLSRRASRIIRQNLRLNLGIVAVLVPATAMGLGIGPAVLVHEGSTLVVVANALRLLRYPD